MIRKKSGVTHDQKISGLATKVAEERRGDTTGGDGIPTTTTRIQGSKKKADWRPWKVTIGPTCERSRVEYNGQTMGAISGINVEVAGGYVTQVTLTIIAPRCDVIWEADHENRGKR